MIHLLLADDHQIILDGMVNLLENQEDIRIIATCKNGKEVLQQLHHEKVDVLLLDLDMPVMNGFDCAKEVQKNFPFVKIVILTMHEEKALIQEFIDFGVKGYFLKTINQQELLHAIRTIDAGGDYFPADVTKALIQKESTTNSGIQSPLLQSLTDREKEIITLVAQGYSNKELAEKLFISPRTADTHRTNIMRKLEIRNVAEMVRFAFQNKLVD